MKLKLTFLLFIIFSSCEENLITETYIPEIEGEKRYYTVTSIEIRGELAKYSLSTKEDFINFRDDISLVDSIGKYQIGDKFYVTLENVKLK